MKTKKIVSLALFTALALILSLIESAFPPLAPIPGIKLGLANIITLIILLNYTPADAFLALLVRIILTSFFAGQAMYLLYSMAGGLLCFLAMWSVHRLLKGHFVFLTSMMGGCFHNIGQVLMAFILTRTAGVLSYLPILLISGILTGLFTGLCAFYSQRYLAILFRSENK
ncbi:MAG: Gx transporter family protein [Lachnospiraceae bacterium]|nr:Gx transporter family protein [Lachnospiraceae bacterium]